MKIDRKEFRNYYEDLGVDENATESEIKKAYRRLSLKHHPDRGGNSELMHLINEAYETLSDETKRSEYNHRMNL